MATPWEIVLPEKTSESLRQRAREPAAIEPPVVTTTKNDLTTARPSRLVLRAVIPTLVAVVASVALVGVTTHLPDLNVIAGKPVPAQVVPVGAILAKVDGVTRSQDYALTFPAEVTTTTMLVWDYAAEDGDMVAVVVNGAPLTQSFTIFHAPKVIRVPANADVQVIGTHDGGGGITYAVAFPDIGQTIVNGIAPGDTTRFTLKRNVMDARQ